MSVLAERKAKIITDYRTHDKDTGSPEVQIAILTERIRELSDHLKTHAKDAHSRRGLIILVGKRNRLLRYIARINPEGYKALIKRLELRK